MIGSLAMGQSMSNVAKASTAMKRTLIQTWTPSRTPEMRP